MSQIPTIDPLSDLRNDLAQRLLRRRSGASGAVTQPAAPAQTPPAQEPAPNLRQQGVGHSSTQRWSFQGKDGPVTSLSDPVFNSDGTVTYTPDDPTARTQISESQVPIAGQRPAQTPPAGFDPGPFTSDMMLQGLTPETYKQDLAKRRENEITARIQQPTAEDVANTAQNPPPGIFNAPGMQPLDRYVSNIQTNIGATTSHLAQKAGTNWKELAETGFINNTPPKETEAMYAAPVGETLDPVTKFVAALPTIPVALADPNAIAAMILTRGASQFGAGNPVSQRLIGVVGEKFGPKVAQILQNQLAHGAGVGAFSGAQVGLEGGSPADIARAAGAGVVAGQAFALPGSVGMAVGRSVPSPEITRAAMEAMRPENAQQSVQRVPRGNTTTGVTPPVDESASRAAPIAPESPPPPARTSETAAPLVDAERPPVQESPNVHEQGVVDPVAGGVPPVVEEVVPGTPASGPAATSPEPSAAGAGQSEIGRIRDPQPALPIQILSQGTKGAVIREQSGRTRLVTNAELESLQTGVKKPAQIITDSITEPPIQETARVQEPDKTTRQEVPARSGQEAQIQEEGRIELPSETRAGDVEQGAGVRQGDGLSEPPYIPKGVEPPTVKPTGSLTRAQIEQDLVSRHQSIIGPGEQEQTHAHTRTFYKRFPSEITERMTPKEIKAANLQIVDQRAQSGGEDYAHDVGWENYISELKGGTPGVGKAKEFFASGKGDPEAQFLGALHDVIAGKKQPKMGTVDPSTLKEGDTFTVAGKQVKVEKNGTGESAYLVLKDGEDLPTVPVEAMGKIPVDKGTVTKEKTNADSSKRVVEGPPDRADISGGDQPAVSPAPEAKIKGRNEAGSGGPPAGAEGGAGKAEPKDPNSIGLSKQDLADLRETYDLKDAPEQQVRHVKDVLALAKRDKLDESAEENASKANAEGRPMSDEHTAGAAVRVAALDKEFRNLKQQAAEARAGDDAITADKAEQDAEAIRQRMNALVDAIDLSTSSAGRSLGIIAKLRLNRETVDLAHEIRVFEKAKRAKSTSEERAQLESVTKILIEAQKDRDAALKREAKKDAAIAKLKAGQILTRNIPRNEPGRRIADAKQKLALERNQLRGQLLSLTRRANDITGIAPEALYIIGKIAINHIRDGALTLEDIYRRTKEDTKDAFPDMTQDDVNLAMMTKDPTRQTKAKDLTEKRVAALKREAALTLKLSEQAAKMKEEAPAKSAAADAAMREQQAALNEQFVREAARKRAIAENKTRAQADAAAERAAKEWKRQDEQRAKNEARAQEAEARKKSATDQRSSEKAAREAAQKQDRSNRAQMRLVLDQLKINAKDSIDAGRRRDTITAKIDALKQHLTEQSRPIKGKEPAAPPLDIAELKQQVEDLRKSMRTQDTLTDLEDQIRTGDFKVAAKITPKPVPRDVQLNQIKITKARQKLNQIIEDARPKTVGEKIAKGITKWVRIGALSHPTVLAKLTGAAVIRTLSTPIEQAIGVGISKALPRLAEQAPREGAPSAKGAIRAEAAAQVRMWTKGIRGSVEMLKNRETDLELEHGNRQTPPELSDYFGRLHGALKNPTKENEYARSLTLRTEHAIRNGVDVSDPIQQMRLSNEAYQDANRSIFLQDNKLVDGWNRLLGALEAPDKETGKRGAAQYLATALRAELPIVKVPTNVVHEASQILTGMLTGPARAAFAYARGIENLKPVEADAIMRQMKKGSIGAAMLALGFFGYQSVGGFYQKGEKRDADEPQAGDIGPVPHLLLHNPYMEAIQFGATVRQVAEGRYIKSQQDPNGYISGLAAASLGLIDEIPFVRENSTVGKLMDPRQRDNAIGAQLTSKLIPGVVQWIAKQTDRDADGPIQRKPTGIAESLKAAIPGLRGSVPTPEEVEYARKQRK